MSAPETIDVDSWEKQISPETRERAIRALEEGRIVYLPHLSFRLTGDEKLLLSPDKVDPKSKNISYDRQTDRLKGTNCEENEILQLKEMLGRYAQNSGMLLDHLFPHYSGSLIKARTSFRPVEASGRPQSYRKDDTRLHVDAFPANPVKGERILRVFTNINLDGKPRVWRVGEPFADVVKRFAPKVRRPFPGSARLLQILKITKGTRTLYDHYMLKMHDAMKADVDYQKKVPQLQLDFPPGSTWIVYSDQTSHAAMSGQHLLEQTCYLPYTAMKDINTTPLKVLENFLNRSML